MCLSQSLSKYPMVQTRGQERLVGRDAVMSFISSEQDNCLVQKESIPRKSQDEGEGWPWCCRILDWACSSRSFPGTLGSVNGQWDLDFTQEEWRWGTRWKRNMQAAYQQYTKVNTIQNLGKLWGMWKGRGFRQWWAQQCHRCVLSGF